LCEMRVGHSNITMQQQGLCATRHPVNMAPPMSSPTASDTVMIPVKLCSLPPFHPVAAKLMTLSLDGGADLKQLVSIVSADPALAAEILFLANSSLFGFPARIESLRHAVAVLGMDCIRQIAVTLAMRALARGTGPFVHDCWRHSIACAVIGEKLSAVFGCSTDQAYSAGLLHDAGRLGFLRTYPSEIGVVLDRDYADAEAVMDAERLVMNSAHTEAGAWLMEYWVLPAVFGETCAHHHDELAESDSPLLRCIKTACRLASSMGYTPVRYRSVGTCDEVLEAAVPSRMWASLPKAIDILEAVEGRLRVFDRR